MIESRYNGTNILQKLVTFHTFSDFNYCPVFFCLQQLLEMLGALSYCLKKRISP